MRFVQISLLTAFIAVSMQAQQPASFTPAPALDSTGNLPAQRLGPNDLLAVNIYGEPQLSRTIRVGTDGKIRLPMIKQQIKADGLLPADLEALIAKAYDEENLLQDPQVTVTISEYHSRPISVVGAVKMPITFQASAPVTLLEALARAQGLRDDAGTEISVTRPQADPDGKVTSLTQRINYRDLVDHADASLNLALTGGEEIRVPEVNKIYVIGNVKKPGAYPVQKGGETTVFEIVALAEGLTPYHTKEAFIYRREASGTKNEIPIPLEKIFERKAPDVPLQADDILYIPDNKGRRLTLGTLEKIAAFGSAAGAAAVVYH